MAKLAKETFFYWDGSKEVAVYAGDARADAHADVTRLPAAFVSDPPTAAELDRVPVSVRRKRG